MELSPVQQFHLEEARKSLVLAGRLADAGRRARGQDVLRDAQMSYDRLPRWYKDEEYEKQFAQTHSLLYRGF